MAFVDIAGQKFGKLVALYPTGKKTKHGGNAIWMCQCDCGNYTEANTGALRCGGKKSCGCAVIEHTSNLNKTHGGRKERLYLVWMDMRRRCRDPKDENYKNYGGRGISVCQEWDSDYSAFRSWSEETGYDDKAESHKCTLDRIDVNGNYEPSNCRWVDMKTQCNNRRNNVMIAFRGEVKSQAEWSRVLGFNQTLIRKRLAAGWDVERALTEQPRVTKRTG